MNNSPTVSSTSNVREKHAVFLADFKMILFVSMVEVRKITFTYTYALIALTGSVDTSSGTRAGISCFSGFTGLWSEKLLFLTTELMKIKIHQGVLIASRGIK